MYVFLSPHFDDAIGSAGGVIKRLIDSGNECCVMTIMAAVSWSSLKAAIYVLNRRSENRRAAQVLNCSVQNAPFFDAIYRKEIKKSIKLYSKKYLFTSEITEYDLVNEIRGYILANTKPDDILIAPAGLGNHIDHRIVNLAVRDLDRRVYYYEEFYYDIKDKVSILTVDYKYVYLNQNEIEEKLSAMLNYRKTLRKLFRRNWRERTTKYYLEERMHDNKAYERFNSLEFLT